jgi:hypothetical protein
MVFYERSKKQAAILLLPVDDQSMCFVCPKIELFGHCRAPIAYRVASRLEEER